MKSILARIPASHISDIELPGCVLATKLRPGNQITVIVDSIDEQGNEDTYMSKVTISQPIISADGKSINLFCNIKSDKPINIPFDCYVLRYK
jgi:hypothetical protein